MLAAEQDSYLLIVKPDDITISPREVDGPLGTMVCFHSRYSLGDKHNYERPADFRKELYIKAVGGGDQGEEKYDALLDSWEKRTEGQPWQETMQGFNAELMQTIQQENVVLPLFLLDHSGLAMRTTDFNDPWDSGQVGWIYASHQDIIASYNADKITPAMLETAEAALRGEVEVYDAYLRGECYGFELYKNGELTDSCWGFLGDIQEACKDMAGHLPKECRGMIDSLEEMERPGTIVQTLLRHARTLVDQTAKSMEHTPRQQEIGAGR